MIHKSFINFDINLQKIVDEQLLYIVGHPWSMRSSEDNPRSYMTRVPFFCPIRAEKKLLYSIFFSKRRISRKCFLMKRKYAILKY